MSRLPAPDAVREALHGSAYHREIETLAEKLLRREYPLLGFEITPGDPIDWRRDFKSGRTSAAAYFRRIPYLDFARVGDHKVVWELNRLQHLVLLAQAWLLGDDPRFGRELTAQLEDWRRANPMHVGVNWASALEVAFRALSLIWIFHWVGGRLDATARRGLLEMIYQHGRHLEYNLSVYFSPNTHLLGEAVVLHAVGALFPDMPGAEQRRALGRRVTLEQLAFQVRDDGSHFEQSTYYHLYAVDFFLLHHVLEPLPEESLGRLRRMADFLADIVSPEGALTLIGDDDGGRVFHPYGARESFALDTLETCARVFPGFRGEAGSPRAGRSEQAAWWLGPADGVADAERRPRRSRRFPDSGLTVMTAGDAWILVDSGLFGYGGAGHSHSDALSFVAHLEGRELLIDPGTFTYVADPERRDWFRSSAAHNTVRVDGADQAAPAGPFRWAGKPHVECEAWESGPDQDLLRAVCLSGVRHTRTLILAKQPRLLFIVDQVSAADSATEAEAEHTIEQFWHAAGSETARRLHPADGAIEWESGGLHGRRSTAFGAWEESPTGVLRLRRRLPVTLAAVLDLQAEPDPDPSFRLVIDGDRLELRWKGRSEWKQPLSLEGSHTA